MKISITFTFLNSKSTHFTTRAWMPYPISHLNLLILITLPATVSKPQPWVLHIKVKVLKMPCTMGHITPQCIIFSVCTPIDYVANHNACFCVWPTTLLMIVCPEHQGKASSFKTSQEMRWIMKLGFKAFLIYQSNILSFILLVPFISEASLNQTNDGCSILKQLWKNSFFFWDYNSIIFPLPVSASTLTHIPVVVLFQAHGLFIH